MVVERYATVRGFVKMLCRVIEFEATADAQKVLTAMRDLPGLLGARPTGRVPKDYLDARRVSVDLVPGGWWQRLVFPKGRPEGTVDRNAYVFCVLELFHTGLRHRDIFATVSDRWSDPRARLLAGSRWDDAKGAALSALHLPEDPDALLAAHTADLDTAWRATAGGIIPDGDVSGTPKDTLHVVDLVYNPDGGPRPEVLITNQGSYSDVVFGIVTLLGFDYRPVLADLPDAKLWRINASADYGTLDQTARGRLDLDKIRRHWPDVLRVIASVHTREISAHDVIRILQHDGRLTQLGEAIASYGRIFKTLHVLTFADDPAYRRQLKAMRNLQEGRHGLGRHLFHGRKGELHRAYHAGMEDQLGALGLVLNCVTLWNTLYLDHALSALRAQGYPVTDADAARLSAYQYRHINVHGHYSFALPDLGGNYRPLRDPDAPGED